MNQDRELLNEIKLLKQEVNYLTGLFEGFLTGFKGSAPVLSAVRPPKFPLPQGATFKDIVAKMVDFYILLSIKGKGGKPQRINFVELGCNDKRKKGRLIPDSHWHLLQRLAEHDGVLTWHKAGLKSGSNKEVYDTFEDGFSITHTDRYSGKDIIRIKNLIYGLRKKLKDFFGLADDPFYRYDEVNCYKTKFEISKYDPKYFGSESGMDEENDDKEGWK